jgi:hypothetical protein
MCAIDALGIADMVGASVLIKSADPETSEPVSVAVDGNGAAWNPIRPWCSLAGQPAHAKVPQRQSAAGI